MSRSPIVSGVHRVPGDKSITHRALLFAALAAGDSSIEGALTSLDAQSSARVLRQLGAEVAPLRSAGNVRVRGQGVLQRPSATLNCGNSGTTARLLLGILAAQPFQARVSGDASLRRRPMRRVTEPLQLMGATVSPAVADGLPLRITGGKLAPLSWSLPVASAQIKSALLLAGALARVPVELEEPGASRDHTERLLAHFGFQIHREGARIRMLPTGELRPFHATVPGDPSSAAFLIGATLLASAGEIRLAGVGLNPTRTGFLGVLERMGAVVDSHPTGDVLGEPRGDLVARATRLRAVDVDPPEVPGIIDEIPILAILASRAEGTSTFRGLAELRVKESDRLSLLASNLQAVGASAVVEGDSLIITGSDRPGTGRVVTHGDHRIAMAFGVLGTLSGSRISIDDPDCAAVSFPDFDRRLAALFQGAR